MAWLVYFSFYYYVSLEDLPGSVVLVLRPDLVRPPPPVLSLLPSQLQTLSLLHNEDSHSQVR